MKVAQTLNGGLPAHVARQVVVALEHGTKLVVCANVVYAAHRIARVWLLLEGTELPEPAHPKALMAALSEAVEGKEGADPPAFLRHVLSILESGAHIFEQEGPPLVDAAEGLHEELQQRLREALETLASDSTGLDLGCVTVTGDAKCLWWTGPLGAIPCPAEEGRALMGQQGTFLSIDERFVEAGPCLPDGTPLIPLGAAGLWEAPDGTLYATDALTKLPAGPLGHDEKVLGRLLWMTRGREATLSVAQDVADMGLPAAAVEMLLLHLFTVEVSTQVGEEALAVLEELDSREGMAALRERLLPILEAREREARESGDMERLIDVLSLRQRLEERGQKARTLTRLKELLEERLNDAEGAFVCLSSAVESDPMDANLAEEFLQRATDLGRQGEAADRLVKLAEQRGGEEGSKIALLAARLFLRCEPRDLQGARRAYKTAARYGWLPKKDAIEASNIAAELRDHEWQETLLHERLNACDTVAERVELLLALGLLHQEALNQKEKALSEFREAFSLNPGNVQAIGALLDFWMVQGKAEEARKECKRLLATVFARDARVYVLKRCAAVAREIVKEPMQASAALIEAVALAPDDSEAFEDLREALEQSQQWDLLLAVLHEAAEREPGERATLSLRMAEIAERRLGMPGLALAYIQEARKAGAAEHELQDMESRLYEAAHLWNGVARALESRASKLEGTKRAETLMRLHGVLTEKLHEPERAIKVLEEAVVLLEGPDRLGPLLEMAQQYRDAGQPQKELRALEEALEILQDDQKRAEVLFRCATLLEELGHGSARVIERLEQAIEIDPTNVEATEHLADLLAREGQYEKAVAAVLALAEHVRESPEGDLERRLRKKAANFSINMGDMETALAQLDRLNQLGALSAQEELEFARLLTESGKHEDAYRLFSELARSGDSDMSPLAYAEALNHAAEAALHMGKKEEALEWKLKSLEIRGEAVSDDELRGCADLALELGDAQRAAELLHRLVRREAPGPKRFADKVRLADVYKERLHDPARAVDWYLEAASEGISQKSVYLMALDAAIEARDSEGEAEILERLIDLEQDGDAKARYHYAYAQHLLKSQDDSSLARQHLRFALTLNPDFAEARRALESMFAREGDQAGLAELYQFLATHYAATGQNESLKRTLAELVEAYAQKLGNIPAAVQSCARLVELEPNDVAYRERLAELLSRVPGREAEALDAHRKVVEFDPTQEDSYKAIYQLAAGLKEPDLMWCAAGALVVLGKADDAQAALFEEKRTPSLSLRSDHMPDDAFHNLLVGQAVDGRLREVLAILFQPARKILPWKGPRDIGLSDGDLLDPLKTSAPFARMARAASKVLGIPLPPLYLARGRSGIAKVAFDPPALVIGDDVAQSWRGKQLRFGFGRALVAFARGFELAGIVDMGTLRLIVLAALKLVFPDFPLPEDARGVEDMSAELDAVLGPQRTKKLESELMGFKKARRAIDMGRFLEGVDRISLRAGLFMANDILVAVQMLKDDTLFLSDMDYGEKVLELCSYLVSSKYQRLRRMMLRP